MKRARPAGTAKSKWMKRYWPAILVLVAPTLIMLLVQRLPLLLLPGNLTDQLGISCYVRFSSVKLDDNDLCKPRPAPAPGATAGAGTPGGGTAGGTAGAGAGKPKSTAQQSAIEAKARAEFGVASTMLVIISIGAAAFALRRLYGTFGRDRTFIYTAVGVAVVLGAAVAAWDAVNTDFAHALINKIIQEGMAAKSLPATMETEFDRFVRANLAAAYIASALLLVYLASLTIPDGQTDLTQSGVLGLQYGVLIGAMIFALGGYANRTGVAWATVALDDGSGAPLIDLSGMIVNLWAVSASAFMITAIAASYYGIRRNPQPAQKAGDSALALRTPEGDDFKALGWIVQVLIALAPIWLPAGLSKFVDVAKTIP